MEFASNSVLGESLYFVDLGLSPTNVADKLKFVFAPSTRVDRLTDNSDWITSRHGYKEVTVGTVSEAKVYSNYIKILSLKLPKFLSGEIFHGLD